MNTKKTNKNKFFVLLYDCNTETECFLSVVVTEPIPNSAHCYHGNLFEYKHISGDAVLYRRAVSFSETRLYNGHCTALQEILTKGYDESCGKPECFLANVSKNETFDDFKARVDRAYYKYLLQSRGEKEKNVYELIYSASYFKRMSTEKIYAKMKEHLDDFKAAHELEEEIKTYFS